MMVISGTIDRSWNSRIEKARLPAGVLIEPSERRLGSTRAVDDRASGSPIASDAARVKPVAKWTSAVKVRPLAVTCSRPSPECS